MFAPEVEEISDVVCKTTNEIENLRDQTLDKKCH